MSAACSFAPAAAGDVQATACNIFAPPALGAAVKLPAEYSAWLDQTDRIVHVSANWDRVMPPVHHAAEVLARPVGWFVGDQNLRECYRSLFARVRQEHRSTKLAARCDVGAEARALQLALIPLSAGAIELRWSYFDGNAARRVLRVPHHPFADGDLLRMCGWCHAVNLGPRWQRLEDATSALGLLEHGGLPAITHGICPDCCNAVAHESSATRTLEVAV